MRRYLPLLTLGFEGGYGYGDGEIQAAGVRLDWDAQAAVGVVRKHPAGKPLRFAAEDEYVIRSEGGTRVGLRSRLGEEPE